MSDAGDQLTWYANVDAVRSGRRELPDGYRSRPVELADESVLAQLYFDA